MSDCSMGMASATVRLAGKNAGCHSTLKGGVAEFVRIRILPIVRNSDDFGYAARGCQGPKTVGEQDNRPWWQLII